VRTISALTLLASAPLAAQESDNGVGIHLPEVTAVERPDVPFEPGEQLIYQVKLGIFSVGEGFMQVFPIDTVHGHPTYPVELGLDASHMFGAFKVRDRYRSWMDTHTLASRRFHKDQHELSYKAIKQYDIYPERREWERTEEDVDDSGTTLSETPRDEIGFIYYLRTLDLEVGEEYVLNDYFKEDGNPLVLKVLRKERKKVPAGTFDTVVVQPIIQTDGLFSEGGNAELYFTDDRERHLVYMRSEIPVVGSITLHLKEIRDPSLAGTVNGGGGDGG
jgi:hypothetical protein